MCIRDRLHLGQRAAFPLVLGRRRRVGALGGSRSRPSGRLREQSGSLFSTSRENSPLSPGGRPPDRHLASSGAGFPILTRGLAISDPAGPGDHGCRHLRHGGDRHGLHLLPRPQKACLSARRQIPVPSPAPHGEASRAPDAGPTGGLVVGVPAGEAGSRKAAGRSWRVTGPAAVPGASIPGDGVKEPEQTFANLGFGLHRQIAGPRPPGLIAPQFMLPGGGKVTVVSIG